MAKTITILGSTGSIGKNVVEIIKVDAEKYQIIALTAKENFQELISQALLLKPLFIVIENPQHQQTVKDALSHINNCQVLSGIESINEVAKIKCDILFSAIVGSAGVLPTINAIKAGSNIAIANKESLVVAGDIIMEEVKKSKISLLPIDSEHNAIFQVFEQANIDNIEKITITASGGPFFRNRKDPKQITVEEALKHPNWQMGAKISIDCATMMNKGLEMIEAYRLFPVAKSQLKILIHPQSIIHGMVEYRDGSSLAMLSYPDMKTPISYALEFPKRLDLYQNQLIKKFDLAKINRLEFFEVDDSQFPAVKLCNQALETEGSALVVLNGANEIAVEKFLKKEITFDKITTIIEKSLNQINHRKLSTIEEIIACDKQARTIANSIF
ncbi:MAG: 1-deoxy-D-xylulose-5-phosphate reductoisomerase [Rickettsiales bacterium]|nr:1-deoxy-D-xylulose-5-phosphate reductoisomerase [Rickettsiales bacterium]